MKDRIRRAFNRLFFYSSRQLWRRWRTYLSVFFTSICLLALVMCILELFQSLIINQHERDANGTWHACFLDSPNDLEDKIEKDPGVKDAWTVTWTSRLASSEDATAPGKLSVLDKETEERFAVRWLWGHAPENGEIAVSRQFYEAYGWMEPDVVNDFWFKAGEMTYCPLKLSGIYIANDKNIDYVFVSKKTAAEIDRETGAHPKYDTYFQVGYVSDRYVAKVVDRLYRSFTLGPTDDQQLKDPGAGIYNQVRKYADYLNPMIRSHNSINAGLFDIREEAIPTVILMLPVIAMAALILASFMSHWTAANAPEFGVLGAIGATRRNLCSIAAGQVLLIALLSSPPVILFSSFITNLYIRAYNAATLGTGLVFYLPWVSFAKVALWFAVLSCVFTYIGIARMTLEEPYILMTGSYRGEMPFVRTSSLVLSKIKNKVARLALIETMRQIKGDAVQILVTAIVSVVVAVFAIALAVLFLIRDTSLEAEIGNIPTDTRIASTSAYDDHLKAFKKMYAIPEKVVDRLRNTPGITFCGTFTACTDNGTWTYLDTGGKYYKILMDAPCIQIDEKWDDTKIMIADEAILPYLYRNVVEGDPDSIFSSDDALLYIGQTEADYEKFPVGSSFSFAPKMLSTRGVNTPEGEVRELTVTAALTPKQGIVPYADYFIISRSGADKLGICPADECRTVYLNYDHTLSDADLTALLDGIAFDPLLMRYEITNVGAKNSSEQSIRRATTMLVALFCLILYISFAVMSVTHVKMKAAQARRDIAIKRQLGADDGAIYREMRIGSYPASAIAIGLTLGLALLCAIVFILLQMATLSQLRDRYPFAYTPDVVSETRMTIFLEAGLMILVSILALPVLFLVAATAAAGTIPPTRAVLKEPITEGLRKGTD